ncbi:MAG TPA: DEAD/DEAH box helicase [Salinimicrobium sp.]|nr:DEAD/DEAH box helicase [Salinimicrobium sp.]
MGFKKLDEPLKEAIERLNYEFPLQFQEKLLPKIKSGADLFIIAPENSGKTTAMIISVIQKLNCAAFEDAPRALIFVKDKEAALVLEEEFRKFIKYMDLRIYSVFDKPNIETEKNDIYEGVDIVISTPKKLNKLFSLSGINISQLKMCIIEDAEFITGGREFNEIIRIPQHIPKCQYLVISTEMNSKMEKFRDIFMQNARMVKAK